MNKHEDSKHLIATVAEQNPAEIDAGLPAMDRQAFSQKIIQAESWRESEGGSEDSDRSDASDVEEVDEFFENFDPHEAIKPESETSDSEPDDQPEVNEAMIVLSPKQTLENIEQLYQLLQQRLAKTQQIEFDASAVMHIDTATLQLLVAFQQAVAKQQKEVTINFPSEPFIEAAQLLGLDEILRVDQATAGFF